jgi:hypothetical protein
MSIAYSMSRRGILALGAMATTGILAPRAGDGTALRPVVVELFTSQGCSSCPPADAFMKELKSASGVLAMSFHIDYWDYLGWRDTLGDSAYSERQRSYAKARGDGDVYTPQMVIDGASDVVGSDKPSVWSGIERARSAMPSFPVPLSLSRDGSEFRITVGAGGDGSESTLWLMAIAPAIMVKIARGENAGREIAYYNVVRRVTPAGMWHGKALSLTLPVDGVMTPDSKACAALLQSGGIGPVIGAATWGQINRDV